MSRPITITNSIQNIPRMNETSNGPPSFHSNLHHTRSFLLYINRIPIRSFALLIDPLEPGERGEKAEKLHRQ